ncbi:hypothetical protein CFBP6773_01092 [Xanthomonas arboricola pv. fragariae]|nr:hypothetical protein CFBP6773_01092 [Xanthomonas arboricola pv. fragariae]
MRPQQARNQLGNVLPLFDEGAHDAFVVSEGGCRRVRPGKLPGKDVGTHDRKRGADAGQCGRAPCRIAGQDHPTVGPAVHAYLAQHIEVEVVDVRHRIQDAWKLPAQRRELRTNEGALLRHAPAVLVTGSLLDAKIDSQLAVACRFHHRSPTTQRVVLPRIDAVTGDLRNAEVGNRQVHPARPIFFRENQLPGVRADALGDHYKCIGFLMAAGKGDLDAAVVLLNVFDAVTEAEAHSLRRCGLVDDPGNIAAADFHLRSRAAVDVGVRRFEAADHVIVFGDPIGAALPGAAFEQQRLQAHPAQHVSRGAAHVHVLSAVAERRRALHDFNIAAIPGKPPGRGGAGNAGARDKDTSSHAVSSR